MSNGIQSTLTVNDLRTLYLNTELGGNQGAINTFSYAGIGTSTYSFGLPQFDVGAKGNEYVVQFLLSNGFNSSNISELQQQGGLSQSQLTSLNAQLQQIPAATLDQFTDAYLAKNLDTLNQILGDLSTTNPTVASQIANSKDLQLAILDYNNEFGISGVSNSTAPANGMLAYLEGGTVTLSGVTLQLPSNGTSISSSSIQDFISATKYGQANPVAVSNRYSQLVNAQQQVDASQDYASDSANNLYTNSLIATSSGLNGDLTCSVDGSGVFTIAGSNGSVGLLQNGSLNINASNSTFSIIQGVTATAQGSGNSLQCGKDDNLGIQGNNNLIYGAYGTINIQNGDTGNQVDGNQNTIDTGANFAGIVDGSNNQVNLASSSNSTLTLLGTGAQITSTGNGITLDGSSSSATVTGVNTILMNDANQSLTLTTNGDTVDASAGDTGETLIGSGFTLDATNGAFSGTISGGGDTFNLDANSGSSVDLNGSGDVINSVGNDMSLGVANATATFNGSGNDISLYASGQTVLLNAGNDTVDGSNGTIDQQAGGVTTTVIGSGNTIGTTDGAGGDTLLLQGNDIVHDSNDTIDQQLGGVGMTVIGNGNTIGTTDGAGGDTLLLQGNDVVQDSNDTIDQQLGGVGMTVIGSGNTIGTTDGAGGDTLLLQGNDVVQDSNDTIDQQLGGVGMTVIGSGNTIGTTDGASGDTLLLEGNDVVQDSSDTIDQQLTNMSTTVIGSGNTIGTNDGADGDTVLLEGNNTVQASSDTIDQQLGGMATTVTGSDDTIGTTDGSTHDTVSLSSGDRGDVIEGSYDTLTAADQDSFTLDGNNNTVTGSDDQIALSGQGDIIDISHATIDVSGDDGVTIDGSDDKIVGGNGDSFTVTGTDDTVDASDSSVTFDGSNTGDYVSGSGDAGSNWDDPTGSGGYSDPGAGYYGYGLTKWKNTDPSAAQLAKAEHSDSVYEGAKWADKTITWSFASAGNGYSGAVTDTAEQVAVEQAFQSWAKASGVNFDEMAAGSKADIEVGFSDLNPASTNEIGLTKYWRHAGVLTGAKVELEDPTQAPLTTDANGQLTYANTGATFEQVALHEIGHALGLADTDVADSIMGALLGADNQTLGAADMTNAQELYAADSSSSSSASLSQMHQLVQAMSVFDAGEQGIDLNPTAELYLQKRQLFASSLSHAHAA